MRSRARRGFAVLITICLLTVMLSCGHDQQLVGITVTPADTTIDGIVTVQYRAVGQYIHPPVSKDITSTVLWQSSVPSVIAFDPANPGQATPTGTGCGTNLTISAVVYSNPANPAKGSAVIGSTTVNVVETQLPPPCGP